MYFLLLVFRHKYSPNQSGIIPSLRESVVFIWKTGIGVAMIALCGILVGKCLVKSKKDLLNWNNYGEVQYWCFYDLFLFQNEISLLFLNVQWSLHNVIIVTIIFNNKHFKCIINSFKFGLYQCFEIINLIFKHLFNVKFLFCVYIVVIPIEKRLNIPYMLVYFVN